MQRVHTTVMLADGVDARYFEKIIRNMPEVAKVVKCRKGLTPVASHRKGRRWERDAAKLLSLWISGGEDEHVFTNRSGSGGSGRDQRGFSGCCGDIQTDKPVGQDFIDKYCVEFKFYEDLTDELWKFFVGMKTPRLTSFWDQARKATDPYPQKQPLLIVKINNRPALVFSVNDALGRRLCGFAGVLHHSLVWCFAFDLLLRVDPLFVIGKKYKNRNRVTE